MAIKSNIKNSQTLKILKMVKSQNNLMSILIISIVCISLCSCENKRSKNENLKLLHQVDSLKSLIDVKKENEEISYNEQVALQNFKDYVSFYCKNCDYKDFKVRKYSQYSFDISMQRRSHAEHVVPGWTGVVIRLTFNNNGKYTIKNIKGLYDFGCQ